MNRDAGSNLEAFQSRLNTVLDTLNHDIGTTGDARAKAIDTSEDARYNAADTVDEEKQERIDWQTSEILRSRIVLMDALMMSAGWGITGREEQFLDFIDAHWGGYHYSIAYVFHLFRSNGSIRYPVVPGLHCPDDFTPPFYKTVASIGRDEYIRQYWHKEQPLARTYTAERLEAVESVVDNLEQWLQDTADMWWEEHEKEYCDAALESFKAKKQEIISENPLPTD